MKIDRSNYEIWLIDWLDGNLNDIQVEELKLFLSVNPDLKEEFEELSAFSLKPSEKSYPDKSLLKKSTADIPDSQFEYLCVAFLENEITSGQRSELMEILDHDSEKKRTFELFQKIKLTPYEISFKDKNRLIKRSTAQKVIRLSVFALSSAAAIVLIIMTFLNLPQQLTNTIQNSAQNVIIDSINQQQSGDVVPAAETEVNKPVVTNQKTEKLVAEVQTLSTDESMSERIILLPADTSVRKFDNPDIVPVKVPVNVSVVNNANILRNSLVASNISFNAPAYDDERSNIGRFIAKTFREKILKEDISKDTPLKGYEIAEAGVTGLNKLLGWEMALEKNNDENGELKSVYFSSRILKFNAPVKKSEPLP